MGYPLIIVTGNLTKVAELKHSGKGDGDPYLSFRVACSESKFPSEYLQIFWYTAIAEKIAPYLTKGKQIQVIGRLMPDEDGRPDFVKPYDVELGVSPRLKHDGYEKAKSQAGKLRRQADDNKKKQA